MAIERAMRSEARSATRFHRPRRSKGGTGAPLALAIIAALVALSPAASAASYRPGEPLAWSNGVVLCQFAAEFPSVAVSHSGVSGTGVTIALLSLVETTPGESPVVMANLSGLTWSVANLSGDDAYDLAYSAHASLIAPSGGPTPVGSVELGLQFVLPAYAGSPEGPTNQVSVQISVTDWTWKSPSDHLVLAFALAPSYPTSEHLNTTSAPGWLLSSTSNSTGQVLEQVGANATAVATPAVGPNATVAANASLEIPSPSWAEVSVAFGDSAGAFTALSYHAQVGIVIPAKVAGIPVSELAAAVAAGALVSVAVAIATRRVRRRPSKLIYVAEGAKP